MKNASLASTLFFCFVLLGISSPTQLFSQWDKETVTTGGRYADIAVDSADVVHMACLIRPYGSDIAWIPGSGSMDENNSYK